MNLYHFYVLLLKFDVFFFLGFDSQWLYLVLYLNHGINQAWWNHFLISIPVTFALLIVSYFAVRRENKYLCYLTIVSLFVGIIYLITKLIQQYSTPGRFEICRNSLLLFSNFILTKPTTQSSGQLPLSFCVF